MFAAIVASINHFPESRALSSPFDCIGIVALNGSYADHKRGDNLNFRSICGLWGLLRRRLDNIRRYLPKWE
jgi:hypothetical protein